MAFPGLSGVKPLLASKTADVGIVMALVGLAVVLGLFPATLTAGLLGFVLLVGGVLTVIFRASAATKISGFITKNLS